jgi:cell division protein FtsB
VSRLPHLSALPLVLGLAALAFAYLSFTTSRYVIHNYQLHQQESQVRRQIDQLNKDHEQLVAVRDYLKSDEYVQAVARRVLGLVNPGETLVIVSGTTPPPATPVAQGSPGAEWWKELFGSGGAATPAPTPSPGR